MRLSTAIASQSSGSADPELFLVDPSVGFNTRGHAGGEMSRQNGTFTPALAVPVRLLSDITVPSTAPNTDTPLPVR